MKESNVKYPGLSATMAEVGDTYETVGKLIGVSISGISRRMSGKVEWDIGEIKTICEHYGKSFYDLFN